MKTRDLLVDVQSEKLYNLVKPIVVATLIQNADRFVGDGSLPVRWTSLEGKVLYVTVDIEVFIEIGKRGEPVEPFMLWNNGID